MDSPHDALQVCALKVKLNCEACRRKVKKQLRKLHGVQSIDINANEGKVTVCSTLDPDILIAMLAMAGKKAELLWQSKPHEKNQSRQAETKPKDGAHAPPDELDFHKVQLEHLHELAKSKGLKQLELTTHSRIIKMIFKDHKEDPISHLGTPAHSKNVGTDYADAGMKNGHSRPSPPGDIDGCPPESSDGGPCPVTKPPARFSISSGKFCKQTMRGHVPQPLAHYPHHGARPIPMPPPYYGPLPPGSYHAGPSPGNAVYGDVNCGDERNTCSVM